jgi:hypothetical protein
LATSAYAADVPGFDDLFPRPTHLNPGEVVRTANAYLAAMVPTAKAARVQVFVDHAQPATLVADLQAQLQAIGTVSGTHEQSREQGVLSTAQIASLVRDGKKQRNYLDAIFRTVYANNPQKLAAWNSASHVEPGRRIKARHRRQLPRRRNRQILIEPSRTQTGAVFLISPIITVAGTLAA